MSYRQSTSDEQPTSASGLVPVVVSVSTSGHSSAGKRRSSVGILANPMFWYLWYPTVDFLKFVTVVLTALGTP
ncbi:hypothetical protein PC118_g16859 [Phytophthora cactorum]|nr:hypothetical protein PC111_g16020 [Phytophthora cactorum]KAG2849940.1 hypothetical protein PC113_g17238 [Phytophthora cactorum]KAG2893581.1 hypothetical protein PC115_g18433 [Phytophthora cactorum]KAG2970451.1 hypothetical protein PC118_g16859 [Phytophthora cactorum]KAG3055229.1 hypothetical protein PC121_g15885 [Phytophthora cactorum]